MRYFVGLFWIYVKFAADENKLHFYGHSCVNTFLNWFLRLNKWALSSGELNFTLPFSRSTFEGENEMRWEWKYSWDYSETCAIIVPQYLNFKQTTEWKREPKIIFIVSLSLFSQPRGIMWETFVLSILNSGMKTTFFFFFFKRKNLELQAAIPFDFECKEWEWTQKSKSLVCQLHI